MKKYELFLPWLVACVAMVFSLFYSQVKHEQPCTLCWYQRMSIFPLVIILGIAAFRDAYKIILYILPITLIGLVIASFHVAMIAFFSQHSFCPTCTVQTLSNGATKPIPLTFPVLSLSTFFLINALLVSIHHRHNKTNKL